MKERASSLDRLLRAAATVPNEPGPEMPFGFETRVLAHWRENLAGEGVARLLRRVMLTALALLVVAGAGAYRELLTEPPDSLGADSAFTDSVIGGAFEP